MDLVRLPASGLIEGGLLAVHGVRGFGMEPDPRVMEYTVGIMFVQTACPMVKEYCLTIELCWIFASWVGWTESLQPRNIFF